MEPEILARAMVAQYLYNWSDRTYVDMVENHITAEWFVGLGVEQKCFDFTILSKYRKHFKAAAGYNAPTHTKKPGKMKKDEKNRSENQATRKNSTNTQGLACKRKILKT